MAREEDLDGRFAWDALCVVEDGGVGAGSEELFSESGFRGRPAKASGAESFEKRDSNVL